MTDKLLAGCSMLSQTEPVPSRVPRPFSIVIQIPLNRKLLSGVISFLLTRNHFDSKSSKLCIFSLVRHFWNRRKFIRMTKSALNYSRRKSRVQSISDFKGPWTWAQLLQTGDEGSTFKSMFKTLRFIQIFVISITCSNFLTRFRRY